MYTSLWSVPCTRISARRLGVAAWFYALQLMGIVHFMLRPPSMRSSTSQIPGVSILTGWNSPFQVRPFYPDGTACCTSWYSRQPAHLKLGVIYVGMGQERRQKALSFVHFQSVAKFPLTQTSFSFRAHLLSKFCLYHDLIQFIHFISYILLKFQVVRTENGNEM